MALRSRGAKPAARAAEPARQPVYTPDQAAELVRGTYFEERELAALAAMYSQYTTAENNSIPVERLRDIPGTSVIPLFQRVAQRCNTDNGGFIEFSEFVRAMSSLSPRATLEEKLRLLFELFDMNQTGRIESLELFQLLRMTTGYAHDDRDLQTTCDTYLQRFEHGLTCAPPHAATAARPSAQLKTPTDLCALPKHVAGWVSPGGAAAAVQ